MQGYKLWKEGHVCQVRVKADVAKGLNRIFLVKASVSASMKSIKYTVYCHMDQETAKVVYAKCTCKAGQGKLSEALKQLERQHYLYHA